MWRTRLANLFPPPSSGVRVPLMRAPMAGVSGGLLAAETARAGALGSVAAGHLQSSEDVSRLGREIARFRERAPEGAPLCVGFIGHSSLADREARERVERVLREHRPEAVQFFAPAVVRWEEEGADEGDGGGGEGSRTMATTATTTNIDLAHRHGCVVVAQVGSESDAREALAAGADCLVAQGTEAGGHGLRPGVGSGTLPLARRIVALAREWERGEKGTACESDAPLAEKRAKKPRRGEMPVLAAGGVVDGLGVAAALALGCDGAVLGTRLWASAEALGREDAKARLASPDVGPDEAMRTTVVDRIVNTYSATPWPEPYDSSGILRNGTTAKWHGKEVELQKALSEGDGGSDVAAEYRKAAQEGDDDIAGVYAGKGVGQIWSIEGAFNIVTRINEETMQTIKDLQLLMPSLQR